MNNHHGLTFTMTNHHQISNSLNNSDSQLLIKDMYIQDMYFSLLKYHTTQTKSYIFAYFTPLLLILLKG